MAENGQKSALISNVKEEPVLEQLKQQHQLDDTPSIMSGNIIDDDEEAECTTENEHESEIKNSLSKCALCSKSFTIEDDPKLLECLHAACITCINAKQIIPTCQSDANIQSETNIICQDCNVVSQPENLIENRFFSKFLDNDTNLNSEDDSKNEDEKKCTNCSENAVATSWCIDCEEWICQNCVMAHQKLKITKDHTIKPKEDIMNNAENVKKREKEQPSYSFCAVHTHEQLSLYCQTCDQLTCRDCQLSEHRDHKYKFIREIAVETRSSVKTLLNEVCYKRELLKSAMKVIEDRQVLISEKKKNLVQEITQMVVQLTNAISSRGKQLILRLSEVCDQKQNTLNEKKVALDQLSKLTDHCIDFVNYALNKGTDVEMLYSKKSVTNHLQRIKSRRADIPNPEIPVRIHLSIDKIQDLIKVITSIGAIVVDGKVYPSVTPPLEPSTPSTPSNDITEQKQSNLCAINVSMENSPTNQPLTHIVTQPSSNMSLNTYNNQPIPISSHQQQLSIQAQHISNQQHIQTQNYLQHYNLQTHNQNQRMPIYNYNNRIQPQQMMMAQRPGLGNCHQQVTSSTHPHQQQMHIAAPEPHINQNASLRGLLAHNTAAYRPTNNPVQYRFPPRYRYPMNNNQRAIGPPQVYQTSTSLLTGIQIRQPAQSNQSTQQTMLNVYQQQQQQSHMQSARWHIPQNLNSATLPPYTSKNSMLNMSVASVNDTYKITLKNQPSTSYMQTNTSSSPVNADNTVVTQNSASVSQTVSSSMPKTPSPALHEKADENEKSLDKFCQKSLNDLMLTIAKLDSNGIVVIPEAQKNQLDSTQVDSSTDEGTNVITDNSSATSLAKDDPNEDWCAVCMDGGDAVLCCDKCPKVFHLYCHIPDLKSFPDESETWQCMLCTNVFEYPEDSLGEKRLNQMSGRDLRIAQRIVLELYCQYEQSLPFREVVSLEIIEYHKIIKKPIALDVIRDKLKPENENHYTDLKQVMSDIRLMFKNAFTYNPVDSQVYQEARSLEEFFEKLLLKWAPSFAYDDPFLSAEGEEVVPPNRKYRRIIND